MNVLHHNKTSVYIWDVTTGNPVLEHPSTLGVSHKENSHSYLKPSWNSTPALQEFWCTQPTGASTSENWILFTYDNSWSSSLGACFRLNNSLNFTNKRIFPSPDSRPPLILISRSTLQELCQHHPHLLQWNRLENNPVHAQAQTTFPGCHVCVGSESNEQWPLMPGKFLLNTNSNFIPIHVRHADIQ